MRHIFREYDIRGIYNDEITIQFTKALGFELGKIMLSKNAKSVSVGYDARYSNEVLNNALIYGLNKTGIKVYSLGLVPTPLGYFSNYKCDIDANIMITASHNPKEYNGFKITINKESFFANDLANIYPLVKSSMNDFDNKTEIIEYENLDIISLYLDYIENEFKYLKNLDLSVSIDTAGGAACKVAAMVLDRLDIDYSQYFYEFDSNFSAHEPDPTNEQNLYALKYELGFSDFVINEDLKPKKTKNYKKAKIAFGFDGDADRVVCLLKDKIIQGDELCYIFAKNLPNPKILCEVKCSKIIFDEINKLGTCTMCKTGHSNIKKAIKESKAHLAAELSGHVFFNDRYYGYDDAIYAMLRIIELYAKNNDFINVLNDLQTSFKSDEIKIKVEEQTKFKIINEFKTKLKAMDLKAKFVEIDGLRLEFDDGFLLLRASNTSPYLIARFEALSKDRLNQMSDFTFNVLNTII